MRSYRKSLNFYRKPNKSNRHSIKVLQKIENELGVSEDLSLQKHQIFAFLKKKKKATRELENYIAKDPHNLRVI